MRRIPLIMLVSIISIAAVPASANTLIVAEVHSGDLVEFEGGFTVHLTGIAAPDRQTQIGWEAFDFTKRRLEGKRVAVFTWTTDNTAAGIVFGDDGLAFAKIVYGNGLSNDKGASTDIAAELLERGFARVDPDHLPEGYEHYREIERRARDQKLGIWANP
jgi:endonuclease YncB( thermonuclease family)